MRPLTLLVVACLPLSAWAQNQITLPIPQQRTWGVGAGRADINLLSRRTPLIAPTPAPVLPPPAVRPAWPVHRPSTPCEPRPCTPATTVVDGSYQGEKWNVGFHLGSGAGQRTVVSPTGCTSGGSSCGDAPACPVTNPVTYPVTYAWPGTWSYGWGSRSIFADDRSAAASPMSMQPAGAAPGATAPATAVPAATPLPPTDLDIALAALWGDDGAKAAAAFTRHLRTNPDDARARRGLALALLMDRRADDASAMLRAAYRQDPRLASEPIDAESLGLTTSELRELVIQAVGHANRLNSGASWWTVTVLMQAQGRPAQARQMLERARVQGFDADLAAAMATVIRG